LEALEDRWTPAAVTTLADAGAGSLREALGASSSSAGYGGASANQTQYGYGSSLTVTANITDSIAQLTSPVVSVAFGEVVLVTRPGRHPRPVRCLRSFSGADVRACNVCGETSGTR
jgi:hypothetical protein